MSCTQCPQPAAVQFTWPVSDGSQTAPLCHDHAAEWWKTYQHTPAGQGLQIEGLK